MKPLPTLAKTGIPSEATGRNGTVTEEKVRNWLTEPKWASAQVALRAEGWVSIDVDHYDDKHGADQLKALEAKLGTLPATPTSTARGATSKSRQYFFAVPVATQFASKPAPDIEVVQFHHRYAIVAPSVHETGNPYVWYDANGEEMWGYPSVAEFSDLPEKWVEYLTTDAPAEHTGFSGTVEDWLNTLVPGDPTDNVVKLIDTLPTENFNHDDVIRILWKVVRLGAEGHSGTRWALEEIERKWVKPPFDGEEYRKELVVAVEGAVAKGGALEVPELLGVEVTSKVSNRRDLEPLLFADQSATERDENRRTLIRELYRAELTPQEIMTLVWFSKTHEYEHRADLWRDVLDYEPIAVTPDSPKSAVSLLRPEEREKLKDMYNFIDHYCYVATLREENPNMPYHEMNAWVALSLAIGQYGVIPKAEGDLLLNFYSLEIGETTSGKGAAKNQLIGFLKETMGYEAFDNLDIGGDPSPEAIHKHLIERDEQVSWFNTDEADQLLGRLRDLKGYSSGLEAKLTDWYEGKVGKRLRNSDPESNKSATTFLSLWLMGTPVRVLGALDPKQVESGFLARFITAVGEPRKITQESLAAKEQSDDAIKLGYNPYLRSLSQILNVAVKSLSRKKLPGRKIPIKAAKDATERLSDVRWSLYQAYTGHPLWDLIAPTTVRLADNVWKAAALIALSNARTEILLDDVLVATRAAETWLTNLVKMAEGVSANDWTREVERVFTFISSRAKTSEARLYTQFADKRTGDLDQITQALVAQKRIRLSAGAWEAITP